MLKEILKHDVWKVPHGEKGAVWDGIATIVARQHGNPLSGESCCRRFDRLSEAFKKAEMASLRSSGLHLLRNFFNIHIKYVFPGLEEDFQEREQLLGDILPLVDLHDQNVSAELQAQSTKKKKEMHQSELLRAEAVQRFKHRGKSSMK